MENRHVARQRLEIKNETTAVAMQRLATHTSTTTELHVGNGVFYSVRAAG
jgi:hypothetical protein